MQHRLKGLSEHARGLWIFLIAASTVVAGAKMSFAQAESDSLGSADSTMASLGDPPNPPVVRGTTPSDGQGEQTKRILGIIPNFRAVSVGEKLPPQTIKEKFTEATEDSFDYSSIFIPALLAAYSLGTNATPEFHQGAAGYGRYLWRAGVDQTTENYMVEFVVPAATREDPRYYTLGSGGFFKRTAYALSRTVITRTDSGHETFNFGEIVGSGASSGLSNLYYPPQDRTLHNTGKQWGLDVGIDGAAFVVKEFWPDINRHLFRQSGGPAFAGNTGD